MLHRLRDAIRSVDADIIFLQEVVGQNSARAKRHPTWPDQAQHEFLADSVWRYFAYGKNAFYPDGHHGNAIISKFPILHSDGSIHPPTVLNNAVFFTAQYIFPIVRVRCTVFVFIKGFLLFRAANNSVFKPIISIRKFLVMHQ